MTTPESQAASPRPVKPSQLEDYRTRSYVVYLINNTTEALGLKEAHNDHGVWWYPGDPGPPQVIDRGTTGRWVSSSSGLWTGCEGHAIYTSTAGEFRVDWDNPEIGSDKTSASCPNGCRYDLHDTKGNSATLTVTFHGPAFVLEMGSAIGVKAATYGGNTWDSFLLWPGWSGNQISFSIRAFYDHDLALAMNREGVTAQHYDSNAPEQKFRLVDQSDGSTGIRALHDPDLALTMGSAIGVKATGYSGNTWQSFRLVDQSDGSKGIRAFYES